MKRKWKKIAAAFLVMAAIFLIYVEIANRNSTQMNYRQKVLKAFYPAFMWISRLTGSKASAIQGSKIPPVPFHSLKAECNNGDTLDFASFKGKKVLLVNTASNCGFTSQYAELQQLAETYNGQLVVIGFPANDFKEQEKGSDEEIAQFCQRNFGVTFPLIKKSTVIKSQLQHPVFRWLTDPSKNGWNEKGPTWNFSKFLVDENGVLTNYFDPSISPSGEEMRTALQFQR